MDFNQRGSDNLIDDTMEMQIHDCFASVYKRVPNKAEILIIAKSIPTEIIPLAREYVV